MRSSLEAPRDVQTFRAADTRSALDAVSRALGEDAIIIGTREIGGGLWGRPQIEITASSGLGDDGPEPDRRFRAEIDSLRRVVAELRARLPGASPPLRPPAEESALPPIYRERVRDLSRQLVARGVEPEVAEKILQEALAKAPAANELPTAVRAIIAGYLPVSIAPWLTSERLVLALVGPTGVGKTTTIAKIAARALLDSHLKVALITIDNYRLGARDHLARYGEIMRLPLHVATDRETLQGALGRVADANLVLVDTAGRSDQETIAAQGALLESAPTIEIALTLSAASGARELRAAVQRFRRLAPQRLIFTKLDEADGPGNILAAVLAARRPVVCVANGQRVPDDLHTASPASLTEIVAGSPARSNQRGSS
jgi:flagellar biosynthesis protein FlhF